MTTAKTAAKPTTSKAKPQATADTKSASEFSAFSMPNMELPSFGLPNMDMPKIDLASMELPVAVRDMAEKGVEQFRDAYDRVRTTAQESSDMIEDSYETTRQGLVELNLQALEAAKTNTDAAYGFFRDMVGVKSLSQAIELQTSFARKQFDIFSAQSKDMQELTAKVTSDAGEPVKDAVQKMFKDIKAA
jgi:phasin